MSELGLWVEGLHILEGLQIYGRFAYIVRARAVGGRGERFAYILCAHFLRIYSVRARGHARELYETRNPKPETRNPKPETLAGHARVLVASSGLASITYMLLSATGDPSSVPSIAIGLGIGATEMGVVVSGQALVSLRAPPSSRGTLGGFVTGVVIGCWWRTRDRLKVLGLGLGVGSWRLGVRRMVFGGHRLIGDEVGLCKHRMRSGPH
jgi:hypothetical protein